MDAEHSSLFQKLKPWLDAAELASLGCESRPSAQSQREIEAQVKPILSETDLPKQNQSLIVGLLLLWHDHLEAAHTIAQAIETPDGSLVHSIMHRREPDYGNAKYWLRRVGQHSCYSMLADQARLFLGSDARLAARLIPGGRWDPYAFVDACERAPVESSKAEVLKQIQKVEAEVFLSHLTVSID
jgi:hypothetical protein